MRCEHKWKKSVTLGGGAPGASVAPRGRAAWAGALVASLLVGLAPPAALAQPRPNAAPTGTAQVSKAPAAPAVAQNKPPGPDDPYSDEVKPPPDPYDDVTKKLAADSFSEGVKLAGKGQWQEAYEKFRSAWSDFKHWQTASSLAKAELELGKYTDAVRHLRLA